MKADEAELLLQAHRPGKATDSRTQKAVEYAEAHDTLRLRLTEQRRFDEHIGEIVHCIQPPEDLRQKLAAAGSQTAARGGSPLHAILPVLTGVLVLVGIGVFFYLQSLRDFPGKEAVERMVEGAGKMSGLELEEVAKPVGQLGDWFYMHGFEGFAVPAEVAALPAVGTRVYQLDGRSIAQLAVDRRQLLVHVFDAARFGVVIGEGGWRVFDHLEWVAAIQRQGATCCLLTFKGTTPEMHDLLASLEKK
jgi:hypothetical protein